jgi:hypothetical protein
MLSSLFQGLENHFIFYLTDYKDKNELIDFSGVIAEQMPVYPEWTI